MDKEILYSVLLTFTSKKKKVIQQLKAVPIAHKSNGIITDKKGEQSWKYDQVTSEELMSTFNYVANEWISMTYRDYESIKRDFFRDRTSDNDNDSDSDSDRECDRECDNDSDSEDECVSANENVIWGTYNDNITYNNCTILNLTK